MDSCLSADLTLLKIISRLNLREKFQVQRVCRRWKNIALQSLRHHEYLVISELPPSSFCRYYYCVEHASLVTVNHDHLIWGRLRDIDFWRRALPLLQGVKYVSMDVESCVTTYEEGDTLFENYKAMLQLLIDCCGQSLECLCIPEHREPDDETFPLTDSLPSLKHMLLGDTTSQVTKNILTACPNLEYLRSRTSFTEWQMLPKGFKKLRSNSEDLNGINNLLCSPAVQSLEVVSSIKMTSEICYQSYHLSCLKEFYVTIDFDVTNCLIHLARILSFAPVLRELQIIIRDFDEIQSEVWINVLSSCPTLTKLTVYLHEPTDTKINVSLFQDDFAKTIVSKFKNLEHLNIGFHLSSDGLRLLSELENLEYFRHEIHTENMSYDSVFDTDALIYFLSQALSKKLTSYKVYVYTAEFYEEYLILKESFLDFAYKIEQQYFFRLDVCQDDRHYGTKRPHPEKIPGMIYVTGIYLSEWDLLYPEMYSDDEEEEDN